MAIRAVASRTALPSPLTVLRPGLQLVVDGLGGRLQCRGRFLGRDAGRQLLPGRRFADGFGHLADGSDDAAGADAYSWEVLH